MLLYYITDRTQFPGDEPARRRHLLDRVAEAVDAGVDFIQLREKDLSIRDLQSLAAQAASLIQPPTRLLINSRVDVALATAAAGVHLRSDDICPADVRRVWCGADALVRQKAEPLIAVSCHTPADVARSADQGADFAVFAPVFEKQGRAPAGLDQLCVACHFNVPVLALGGVTTENARDCLGAGAAGIAAIRLFQENTIASIVGELRKLG